MIIERQWCQYPGYMDSTYQFGTEYRESDEQLHYAECILQFSYYGCRSFDEIWTSMIIGKVKFIFQPGTKDIALEQYSEKNIWEGTGIIFHGTPEEFINNHVCCYKEDLLWWYRECFRKFRESVPGRIKELQDLQNIW